MISASILVATRVNTDVFIAHSFIEERNYKRKIHKIDSVQDWIKMLLQHKTKPQNIAAMKLLCFLII